jgi:hypothetical protein
MGSVPNPTCTVVSRLQYEYLQYMTHWVIDIVAHFTVFLRRFVSCACSFEHKDANEHLYSIDYSLVNFFIGGVCVGWSDGVSSEKKKRDHSAISSDWNVGDIWISSHFIFGESRLNFLFSMSAIALLEPPPPRWIPVPKHMGFHIKSWAQIE